MWWITIWFPTLSNYRFTDSQHTPQKHTNSGFIAASAIAYFPIFVFTICSDLKEIPFLCDICSHSFKNMIFILSNNFMYFVAISSHWSKHNYASVFVNINLFHSLKSRLYFKMVNRAYKIGFRNFRNFTSMF